MEHEQLLVWLETVPDGPQSRQSGMICRRHADAMVVPRGWTLDDRREPRPRLFKVVDIDRTSDMRRPSRSRQPVASVEPQPQLVFDGVEPDGELLDPITVGEIRPLGERDPEETNAIPWRPVFDENDDLGGLMTPRSPLLSRAFRGGNLGTRS
jgi:hypothetical protein